MFSLHIWTLFQPGGPGLLDPCEKKPVDTLASMGEQQREDITSSAQVRSPPGGTPQRPLLSADCLCSHSLP